MIFILQNNLYFFSFREGQKTLLKSCNGIYFLDNGDDVISAIVLDELLFVYWDGEE